MAFSKDELAEIRQETLKSEHKQENTTDNSPKSKKKLVFVSISSILIVLIVAGFGYSFIQSNKPGILDDFAKCLTEKGAVMYGATFCQYSHAQKGMFGSSSQFLEIKDFTKDENVKKTPTWLITGNYYENVQSLDRLASLTGCTLR